MSARERTRSFLTELAMPPDAAARIGDAYQQSTKYDRRMMRPPEARPPHPGVYKRYADPLRVVALPEPKKEDGPGLWAVIARRRSKRGFAGQALSLEDLSQLLWASQGLTGRSGGYELRAAPSAGALYPVETYLICHRVEGAAPGVWHYRVRSHEIECLREGDFRRAAAVAALGQRMAGEAACVFVWTAVTARCKSKYGERGYRYMYLDAGHIAAHVSLAAEALGLACCAIGALFDDDVNDLVGADGVEETALYLTVVGRPAGEKTTQ